MRFVIFISFLLCGCLGINTTRPLSKEVRYNFYNRFEGNNTGIANKINIAGYYRYWPNDELGRPEKINHTNDTVFSDMIFYEDGTFIWNLWPGQGFSNYEDQFKSVINKGKDDLFYKSHWWGIYSISNDTIKTQYLMHAARFTPWFTGENWYLIKNSRTLQLIFFGDIDKTADKNASRRNDYVKRASLAKFIPLDHIPPPLGWLKKEKFFWKNSEDWEQYMKSMD
jgi:hypothetical protein